MVCSAHVRGCCYFMCARELLLLPDLPKENSCELTISCHSIWELKSYGVDQPTTFYEPPRHSSEEDMRSNASIPEGSTPLRASPRIRSFARAPRLCKPLHRQHSQSTGCAKGLVHAKTAAVALVLPYRTRPPQESPQMRNEVWSGG